MSAHFSSTVPYAVESAGTPGVTRDSPSVRSGCHAHGENGAKEKSASVASRSGAGGSGEAITDFSFGKAAGGPKGVALTPPAGASAVHSQAPSNASRVKAPKYSGRRTPEGPPGSCGVVLSNGWRQEYAASGL